MQAFAANKAEGNHFAQAYRKHFIATGANDNAVRKIWLTIYNNIYVRMSSHVINAYQQSIIKSIIIIINFIAYNCIASTKESQPQIYISAEFMYTLHVS